MTKARSNATANAAKGDLTVGNGTNLSGVLAVGNNGETIVADSSTSTGLRYQAPVNANPILNSAFQIWQRGTSIAMTASAYTADRWQGYRAVAGSTCSRQLTNDTTNLPFIQYCARVQRDSGNTSTTTIFYAQNIETLNSVPYAGKTVTLSFYARAGANYSSASNALGVYFSTGTGTDQNDQTGTFTGRVAVINNQTVTLTTTWQRFSFTVTLGSNISEMCTNFSYTPVGTAGAADYYEITGVQLEVGSVATPFKTYAGTIQGELAACQRYYQVATRNDGWGVGGCITTSQANAPIYFFNEMRTSPTIVLPATGTGTNQITFLKSDGTFPGTIGTISAAVITKNGFVASGPFFTGAFTVGNASILYVSGSTEVWKASAEL